MNTERNYAPGGRTTTRLRPTANPAHSTIEILNKRQARDIVKMMLAELQKSGISAVDLHLTINYNNTYHIKQKGQVISTPIASNGAISSAMVSDSESSITNNLGGLLDMKDISAQAKQQEGGQPA